MAGWGAHSIIKTMEQLPVLLVHGFASSAEHGWREPGWVDLISEGGREVIAVDLLGHGNSPKPTDPAEYDVVESLVAGQIAGYEQVDAIGFSAGSHVLMRLASEHPERFHRLALLGVGEKAIAGEGNSIDLISALEGEPDPENMEAVVFRRLADAGRNDKAALVAFLRREQERLTAADVGKISCPVLIVVGEQDPFGPGDGLAEAIPGSELVTLRGVDHFGTPNDVRCMEIVLGFMGV
jgi:pimeloyl-ACP methyl ester carboxylesterase